MITVTDTNGESALINVDNITFIRQRPPTYSPNKVTEVYFVGEKNNPILIKETLEDVQNTLKNAV